jgi:hypothetical protein
VADTDETKPVTPEPNDTSRPDPVPTTVTADSRADEETKPETAEAENLATDVSKAESDAKPVVIKLEHAIAFIDKFQEENPGLRSWLAQGLKDGLSAIEHHES